MKSILSGLMAVSLAGGLMLAVAPSAMAGPVNQRQENQQERIQQGVKSGELNRREAKRLRQNNRKINRVENRYKSDGDLSQAERQRLDKLQDRNSQAIKNQKNDEQDRPRAN